MSSQHMPAFIAARFVLQNKRGSMYWIGVPGDALVNHGLASFFVVISGNNGYVNLWMLVQKLTHTGQPRIAGQGSVMKKIT